MSRGSGTPQLPCPNKERPFIPRLKDLILTHILQIDFVKEPGKTIAIVEIDIISALAIPLSSDFPKMWVRIRPSGMGMNAGWPVRATHYSGTFPWRHFPWTFPRIRTHFVPFSSRCDMLEERTSLVRAVHPKRETHTLCAN